MTTAVGLSSCRSHHYSLGPVPCSISKILDRDSLSSNAYLMRLFTLADLRESAKQANFSKRATQQETSREILLREAKATALTEAFDIFLSHRHLDSDDVLGMKAELEAMGFSVYVDTVQDSQLQQGETSKSTAETLRVRMRMSRSLIYATSVNSSGSKWMPWELGFFDGFRGTVAVCPITASTSSPDFSGVEYLGLYPYISRARATGESRDTLWVHESPKKYVHFASWLDGLKPYPR